MTQNQIELISDSWSKLSWQSPKLVASFHVHLFNVDHDAQSLFSGDKGEKVTGMMKMIDVAVGLLDQWELFIRSLREFGQQHLAYGVLESHYLGFGEALMLTLGEFLGPEFTPDTQDAWEKFYGLMAKSMIEGSKH
jgi:hemoglobin-like flavoprotein